MSLKTAGFAALAAVAMSAPASVRANTAGDVDCPSARAAAERTQAIDEQIERLDAKLEALDSMLDGQAGARREALSQAEERIQEAVRHPGASPQDIDSAVARAVADANAKAVVTAKTAIALHDAMVAVRAQMEALGHQMHAMADPPRASPATPAVPAHPAAPKG